MNKNDLIMNNDDLTMKKSKNDALMMRNGPSRITHGYYFRLFHHLVFVGAY